MRSCVIGHGIPGVCWWDSTFYSFSVMLLDRLFFHWFESHPVWGLDKKPLPREAWCFHLGKLSISWVRNYEK